MVSHLFSIMSKFVHRAISDKIENRFSGPMKSSISISFRSYLSLDEIAAAIIVLRMRDRCLYLSQTCNRAVIAGNTPKRKQDEAGERASVQQVLVCDNFMTL